MNRTVRNVDAREYSTEISLEEFFSLKEEEADWVTHVFVPSEAVSARTGKNDDGITLTLFGMEAECPYCGMQDRLRKGQWRAVKPECNTYRRPVEDLYGVDLGCSLCDGYVFCDVSAGKVPPEALAESVPLYDCKKYALPTGSSYPLLQGVREWLETRTSLDASKEGYHLGRYSQYRGAYECPRCGQIYGVSFGTDLDADDSIDIGSRFHGYPDNFAEEMESAKTCKELKLAGLQLPERYEDIEEAFLQSRLPNCKRIRRACFERPLIIAAAMLCEEIPFENIDILGRLLEHAEAPWLLYALGFGSAAQVWKYLARTRGEGWLLSWILMRKTDVIFRMSLHFEVPDVFMPAVFLVADELFEGKSIDMIFSEANALQIAFVGRTAFWSVPYPDGKCTGAISRQALKALDKPYVYSERQRELEKRLPEGSFKLPQTPRRLIQAGQTLDNWQASNRPEDVSEENTFVLVSAGFPAIIQVNVLERKVISATLKHGQPVRLLVDVDEAFQAWLKECNLTWNPSEED